MMQEMQRNATNTCTEGGVGDKMTAAIQNADDIWDVNKCKAVMVSFCEGICSFHDDLPPHTNSPTLLWCRIDVTSWNSKKNRNQTRWMLPQRADYPAVIGIKEVVVWVSPQKMMFEVRHIKGAGVQKLKYCGEVILYGRSAWDLCVGRRTCVGGRKPFYDKAENLKVALVLCVWMIDSSETEYSGILRQGMVSGQIIEGDLCSMLLWLRWFGYSFSFSHTFPNFVLCYHACNWFLLLFLSWHV